MSRTVLVMLTITLCGFALWTARSIQGTRTHASAAGWSSHLRPRSAPVTQRAAGSDRRLRRDEGDPRRDLYGNNVSDAVATYSYDGGGAIYEEHSPQTEVPRLKPPIS